MVCAVCCHMALVFGVDECRKNRKKEQEMHSLGWMSVHPPQRTGNAFLGVDECRHIIYHQEQEMPSLGRVRADTPKRKSMKYNTQTDLFIEQTCS